ncbi:MAG: hypothetical protein VX874_03205 [Pseudomonadota bacterium]|nr:hypothetical protein [Pseudomonadota bacterium]
MNQMKKQPGQLATAGALDRHLRDQLDKIREEEVPERLLDLARALQADLRKHGKT